MNFSNAHFRWSQSLALHLKAKHSQLYAQPPTTVPPFTSSHTQVFLQAP